MYCSRERGALLQYLLHRVTIEINRDPKKSLISN